MTNPALSAPRHGRDIAAEYLRTRRAARRGMFVVAAVVAVMTLAVATAASAHCCDPCGCTPPPPPPPPVCDCIDLPPTGAGKRSEFESVVLFANGSHTLDDKAITVLASAKRAYSMFGDGLELVALAGHTDDVGNEADNVALSVRRVMVVKQHLTSLGVDARRITLSWFGESQPAASNRTAAGRAANRRVTVSIK